MELSGDFLALIFIIVFLTLVIAGIIYAMVSKFKGRSTPINSVTFFGATSQFHDVEQKAAVEHMLEVQSDKKMEEEESGDPDKK
jgi:hypothetical protein